MPKLIKAIQSIWGHVTPSAQSSQRVIQSQELNWGQPKFARHVTSMAQSSLEAIKSIKQIEHCGTDHTKLHWGDLLIKRQPNWQAIQQSQEAKTANKGNTTNQANTTDQPNKRTMPTYQPTKLANQAPKYNQAHATRSSTKAGIETLGIAALTTTAIFGEAGMEPDIGGQIQWQQWQRQPCQTKIDGKSSQNWQPHKHPQHQPRTLPASISSTEWLAAKKECQNL